MWSHLSSTDRHRKPLDEGPELKNEKPALEGNILKITHCKKSRARRLDIRRGFLDFTCMAKKPTTIKDRYSKTQILDEIATSTALSRKQVAAVLDSLADVIEGHVKKNSVGEFVLPGLLKITSVRKPAVKARKGISPFTKEEVIFKAKPATTVIKVRALKKLKDMAL
jgi:nucleoid DNA-binding protein